MCSMSYFIRYILVRDETTLATIDAALHLIDPDFNIQVDQSEVETGDLYYKSEILGEITVNRPGDSIRLFLIVESIDQHGEFIATQAADGVRFPDL